MRDFPHKSDGSRHITQAVHLCDPFHGIKQRKQLLADAWEIHLDADKLLNDTIAEIS